MADSEPGKEVQIDTGWVGSFKRDLAGRRRRFRAWIFTPGVSRYRFVYPVLAETTQTAIETRAVIAGRQALRGLKSVSAATIVAEVGPLSRFPRPEQLMG